MPNDYSGIKKVRAVNGQVFINDFLPVTRVVVMLPAGTFFEVRKAEVWRTARRVKLIYEMTDRLYMRRQLVLCIVGSLE